MLFFPFLFLSFLAQVRHPLIYCLLLSCPQIVTARIMTSSLCRFAGGLSEKKQEHTTGFGAGFFPFDCPAKMLGVDVIFGQILIEIDLRKAKS